MQNLRDRYRDQVFYTNLRAKEIRANSLFKVGTVQSGGEKFLLNTGSGVITSQNFGGAVGIGGVVLARHDSGQSYFYSRG